MSFVPRPLNNPHQRHRSGSNLPDYSRFRRQTRSNPSHNYAAGNNSQGHNNNVADFTTKRQQVSPERLPTYPQISHQPLGFSANTKTLPIPNFVPPTPWWLRSLFFLKYTTGLITGGVILTTLTVYGSNVSTQRQWSENYQQLENLRRTERQLVVANEIIKNKAAQESSTTKGLVQADPSRRVYLPNPNPMPEPSPKVVVMSAGGSTAPPKPETSSKNYPNLPLGY